MPVEPPEMSLDLDILDTVTPEGRAVRLDITATDLDGTTTDTTTVPVWICVWFEGATLHEGRFNARSLKKHQPGRGGRRKAPPGR